MAGILFIISAPSGSGKSTLVSALRSQIGGIDFSVSWTTRKPRGSEEHGREYNFTTREEFERMRDRGEFLEYAEVFGNYYGTARHSLEEAGRVGHDLLLDIDVQGAMQVLAREPGAVSIFVMPPAPKVLKTRLRNRSRAEAMQSNEPVDEAVLRRRLSEASKEIENYSRYGYILVNDVLEKAVAQLEAIVVVERLVREGKGLTPETRRVFEVAAGCRLENQQERVNLVLEAFGLLPGTTSMERNEQYTLLEDVHADERDT